MRTVPDDWVGMSVALYTALIRDRMHFAEAAYRDGEWYCMLGRSGSNINGERYDPKLGAALRETLLRPAGQWCTFWWPHPTKGMQAFRGAQKWLAEHEIDVHWLPDRPISRANELGRAGPFFDACRTRRIVLVGPTHLKGLDLFDIAEHIIVPRAVAWQHADRLADEVLRVTEDDDLVLFCAGMASNLMIHRLWPEVRGRMTLLDLGATLDPYCGVLSRGVFRTSAWPKAMERNRAFRVAKA